jgi:hypothetical protein
VITGLIGANVGLLLWPAVALHLILAVHLLEADPGERDGRWAGLLRQALLRRHERGNEPAA